MSEKQVDYAFRVWVVLCAFCALSGGLLVTAVAIWAINELAAWVTSK